MVPKVKRVMASGKLAHVWLSFMICGFLLTAGETAVGAVSNYTIKLVSGDFVPDVDTGAMSTINQHVQELGSVHVLIQFYDIPDASARRSMANEGITLLDPIPENAWMGTIDQSME